MMASKTAMKKKKFKSREFVTGLITLTLALAFLGGVLLTSAQAAFPDKPVSVIVPYRPGGSTDTMIRVYAKALSKGLGQPVIVQNRPGAGGAVGATYIKNQPADGYSFLVGSVSIPVFSPLHDQVDFTSDDFTYLGAITEYQQAIITSSKKPFKTLPELIEYSKKSSDGVVFAEQNSLSKLVLLYIAKQEGVEWRAVPTKGGGGMIPMLLGGQIDFAFSGGVHSRYENKMTVLASLNPDRLVASSNIPSTSEKYNISMPGMVVVMGPKGIPADRVKILEKALKKACDDKKFVELLTEKLKFPKMFKTGEEVKQTLPGLIKQLKNAKEKINF